MPAAEFFLGPMVTSLPLAACLKSGSFPVWPEPRVGVGFQEINARQSDFAFVSAAAQIALDSEGLCTSGHRYRRGNRGAVAARCGR